jgi:hypothetical protein
MRGALSQDANSHLKRNEFAQAKEITVKRAAVENQEQESLLALIDRTAEDFQDPIRWIFLPEEELEQLSNAQFQAMQITTNLEWLRRESKREGKRRLNRAKVRVERRTRKIVQQLRDFGARHKDTYPFTVGSEGFYGELDELTAKVKSLKAAWQSLRKAS